MLHNDELLSRVTVNHKVMLGKATIRGMKITVEQILRSLAGGVSEQELLEEYLRIHGYNRNNYLRPGMVVWKVWRILCYTKFRWFSHLSRKAASP